MACDNFLKFCDKAEGSMVTKGGGAWPKGETKDVAHKDCLEIKTFEFGAENPTTIGSASGGAGAGKVKFQPFKITKEVDMASNALFIACASGAHFPNVVLQIRKAGGAQMDYLRFHFRMVYVTNISWSGGGGEEAPEETVEFVYGAMAIKYIPQDAKGQPMKPNVNQWSQVTNQPTMDVPGITTAPDSKDF